MNNEIRLALVRTLPFLIVICAVMILIKRGKFKSEELDLRKPQSIKYFLIWTIGFLLYSLLVEFLLYSSSILEIDKWNHSLSSSLILIPGAVILAPIAEELLFRGFILNLLNKKKINNHLAVLIQACFFVLLHNFTYQNTLSSNIGIVQSLVDAMLFGYARQYTKSLYTPITMHMTGNAIAVIERFIF
ncbi:CPBP family intramembrane glutamic endopeptidase [Flavobacterium marginilacus]|uniref:CPBP family intramembrane glutamic endopeptidase n=1 Tax=Flavobacterium marginilacus TaxID=3003256 RepID=UPI00248EB71B|nr:CPBP family intramembrane glutamic endopeptidase [Flavobacterium marginilacus]